LISQNSCEEKAIEYYPDGFLNPAWETQVQKHIETGNLDSFLPKYLSWFSENSTKMSEKKTKGKKSSVVSEPELVRDGELFTNFTPKKNWALEDTPTSSEDDSKVDIFDLLQHADLKDSEFYSKLTPKQQQKWNALVPMRWFSTVGDGSQYRDDTLILTNTLVNVNFWNLREHPELQWRLIALCGSGVKLRHSWIAMPKRKKISKLAEFMLQWYPSANNMELDLITNSMTRDDFEQFVKSTGATDQELQEQLEAFDEAKGIVQVKPKAKRKT